LAAGIAAFTGLFALGTVGYMAIEGWTLLESIYMVVITLSTVGFGEVHPLSPAGQTLTTVLVLTGVAAFAYVVATGFRLTLEGELRRVVGRRRMDKEIANLRNHIIVCGYGRVGQEVCRNLIADGVPLVVVEQADEPSREVEEHGLPFVRGDAVEESTLVTAGLDRARGLLLTLSYEADNVYVTLSAKELRPDIHVIARSISAAGERRLRAAGADRVVSPERIGARSMSNSVSRPNAVDFTEIVTARESLPLEIEEQRISAASSLVGRTIRDCEIRRNYGLIVVAIVTANGDTIFNPEPVQVIEAQSTLIILGGPDDVRRFADDVA
jgi:voltage-gated potassium channel